MSDYSANYTYEKDADGIVTYVMDSEGQSANTMNDKWFGGFKEMLDRVREDEGVRGVIIASAKKTFFAGGDLGDMLAADVPGPELFEFTERLKAPLRELEKLNVPVVAAINGAALGGGFEICLAANHRIIADVRGAVVGLPEVTLGLLPGGGGITRLVRMIGLEAALPLLLEGTSLNAQKAAKAGLVQEVVEGIDDLIPAAKAWLLANPDAGTQPWDQKGFTFPGGDANAPNVRLTAASAPTMLFKKTRGLMPAPEKILDIAVNGMRMGFDSALRNESRGLAYLLTLPTSKAAISTFFFGMQAVKGGKVRPAGDKWAAQSSAVLGAGMMGGGIAYAHSKRKIPTVLKDTNVEAAEIGKAYTDRVNGKLVKRGRMTDEAAQAQAALITPSADYNDLKGVDVIVEAVFEDIAVKEKVIKESFEYLAEDGIYGTNTSSLPISYLQTFAPDPSRFIGLHFFSPVDRMKVVEIIAGKQTSEETLRKAYDYTQQIGYMPIVVNDERGFFTSRVFSTFMDEGIELIRDGMNPVAVERASWKTGMPVGPLAIYDEVSLELTRKAYATHAELDKILGEDARFGQNCQGCWTVVPAMCELGRRGRNWDQAGFYDYHQDGSKTIWPGLSQFIIEDRKVSMADATDRILYRQAIETLRCLDENVLRTEVEANLGSIFAIGFPAWTGGALQYIHGIGLQTFKARADELADRYGERFRVTEAQLARLTPPAEVYASKAA